MFLRSRKVAFLMMALMASTAILVPVSAATTDSMVDATTTASDQVRYFFAKGREGLGLELGSMNMCEEFCGADRCRLFCMYDRNAFAMEGCLWGGRYGHACIRVFVCVLVFTRSASRPAYTSPEFLSFPSYDVVT